MQIFGKYTIVHDLEYLTKTYIYVNKDNEDILEPKDLDLLLKKKNKHVAGTIFLYNPFLYPVGYKNDQKLQEQEFNFDNKFVEIEANAELRIVSKPLKHKYKGKLIEVKFLFNYIKENIQPTSALEVFDMDLEKINTNLLTVFAKQDNYHDVKNISYNGKFIFFAWGNKFDKHHPNIALYASNIAQWAKKQGKEISFIYDGVSDEEKSFEYTRFIAPVAFGKLKDIIPMTLEKIFTQDTIKPFSIKNM